MTVDKFGHFLKEIKKQRVYIPYGLQNYNLNFGGIKDISNPDLSNDEANKKYLEYILEGKSEIQTIIEEEVTDKILKVQNQLHNLIQTHATEIDIKLAAWEERIFEAFTTGLPPYIKDEIKIILMKDESTTSRKRAT